MNEINDFDSPEHFAEFVESLTKDKKNAAAVCGIDNPDCEDCGS
jgi:hypothetical protein